MYSVTRIVPSISGSHRVEGLLETGVSMENLENIKSFYKGLTLEHFGSSKDLLKDEQPLVEERIAFAEKCLEAKVKKQ